MSGGRRKPWRDRLAPCGNRARARIVVDCVYCGCDDCLRREKRLLRAIGFSGKKAAAVPPEVPRG